MEGMTTRRGFPRAAASADGKIAILGGNAARLFGFPT
jgi:hypothetical protein